MAAIQLNFTLRTSANVKTVHLLGSWDNYNGQLPLSKDSSKTGGWKGTFRFQGQTLKQGQRYWFYYIIDGYHVSHDPARESVVEPTTGRKLNTLDIPTGKPAEPTTASRSSKESRQSRHARHSSSGVPKGRPLEKSQIISPKPYKPQESYKVRTEQFAHPTLEQLTAKFARQQLADSSSGEDDDDDSESDNESDVPSLSSRSSGGSSVRSGASSPSSVSSTSSCCSCERYGITRSGNRVKLDCGGSRCGYSDGSDCSSESDDDYKRGATRRHGVVVRR